VNASAVGRISVPTRRGSSAAELPRGSGRRPAFAPRRVARVEGVGPDGAALPVAGELAGAAALAAGLKGLMGYAQDTCRLRAVSPTVQLVRYSSEAEQRARLAIHGVHTCKSPLCPLCASKWQRTRSDEITQAIDAHPLGGDGVFFVTLTGRHNRKMSLSLMHRLLGTALGSFWSGSGGALAAAAVGGKPESIRAHDRTWSVEKGWHPHIHALLFVQDATIGDAELAALFDARWPALLASTLKRFKTQLLRILTRSDAIDWEWDERTRSETRAHPSGRGGCGRSDCRVCQAPFQGPIREVPMFGPWREDETPKVWRAAKLGSWPLKASEQDGECWHFRERATRMFGVKLIPRTRREIVGLDENDRPIYVERAVSLHDSALKVFKQLEQFTPSSIRPTKQHGAFVERMRSRDRLPNYLVKLGLELASTLTKLGHQGSDGVQHYGLWEVARIAAEHGHPLRQQARRAWSQLFWATRGTHTITFSDRAALGLPDDPFADGNEPDEQREGDRVAVVGLIEATRYRDRVAESGHGLLIELAAADAAGELGRLGYVDPPGELARELRTVAPVRGPPPSADPCALTVDGYLEQRPDPWLPGVVLPFEARVAEHADNGTSIGEAYRVETALPSGGVVLPDQLRRRLRERIGGDHGNE